MFIVCIDKPEVNVPKLVRDIKDITNTTPESQRKRIMSRLIRVLERAKYRAKFVSVFGMLGSTYMSYRQFAMSLVSLVQGKYRNAGMQFLAGHALQLAAEAFEVAGHTSNNYRGKMTFNNNFYNTWHGTTKKKIKRQNRKKPSS